MQPLRNKFSAEFLKNYYCLYYYYYVGAARWEHRERPSPRGNGKDCCLKMISFPKVLFLATPFPKTVKNAIFH